jgi:dTDP-glucose 4,6-dehydratase
MKFYESNRFTGDGKQKIALVDIDETICFYSDIRRYDLAEPSHENIEKINNLYDCGWKIIYWTARGSVSGADYKEFTLSQLETWGCKFHELQCGDKKQHFDLVIDDKAKRIEEL